MKLRHYNIVVCDYAALNAALHKIEKKKKKKNILVLGHAVQYALYVCNQ